MPRYFFDIHDGQHELDEEGTECATLEVARQNAKRILPDIAREAVAGEDDRHVYTVLVTDEDHHPVYSATLFFAGMWLLR